METLKTSLFLLFFSLLFYSQTSAQTCGSIVLKSQAEVDAFSCTQINGDLTIDDALDGVYDIVNLNPIFTGGMNGGAVVTDNIIVVNCDVLPSLLGLDGIGSCTDYKVINNDGPINNGFSMGLTNISGSLTIQNNPNMLRHPEFSSLTNVGGGVRINNNPILIIVPSLNLLTSVGSNIIVEDCPDITSIGIGSLVNIPGLFKIVNCDEIGWGNQSLQSVGSIFFSSLPDFLDLDILSNLQTCSGNFTISACNNLTAISGLNNLTSVGGTLKLLTNTGLTQVSGFNGLTSAGQVSFINNVSMTTVSGFTNLTNIASGDLLIATSPLSGGISGFSNVQNIAGDLKISNCNIFNDISPFSNINSIGGDLIVETCPSFTDCCIILDMEPGISGSITLTNNGVGCSSYAEIGALPPVIVCEPDMTVALDPVNCFASFGPIDPIPTDDCTTTFTGTVARTSPSGVVTTIDITPGADWTQNTNELGDWTFTYEAIDDNGLSDACTRTFTVVDNTIPQWTDPSLTATFTGICGLSDPASIANSNIPTATDDCGTLSVTLESTEVNAICGSSESHVFNYRAEDDNGNTTPDLYTVIVNLEDNEAPTLSGVPSNVSIFCNDAFPPIPTPTATDQCAGDITADISVTNVITEGDCTLSVPAEIHTYTWEVNDGCGNMASEQWIVTIENDFEIDLGADVFECTSTTVQLDAGAPGSTYEWSNGATTQFITVSSSNDYMVTVTSNNGCCSIDEITVTFGTTPDVQTTGAELDCSGNPVAIMGNSSTPNVTYSWTGPGGYTSTDQNPVVTAVGNYELTVSDPNGCTNTEIAIVTTNNDVPDLVAEGGFVNCNIMNVQLTSNSTVSGITYAWTGPNGFMSTMQNPVVIDAGIYTVVATAPNNCLATATAEVIGDTATPDLELTNGFLNCANTSTTITANSSFFGVLYEWTGPNGFTSNDSAPQVTEPGDYNVMISAPNGCTNNGFLTLEQDIESPNVTATGGILNCDISFITIMANSTTSGVIYSWTGPNGFTASTQNPNVVEAGDYTVTVSAPNGCSSTETVTVIADVNAPDISATSSNEIDCSTTSSTLTSTSSTTGLTYAWTGPAGFTSTDPNPVVTTPGSYNLQVVAPNNCSSSVTVIVSSNTNVPNITISGDEISCTVTSVLLEVSSDLTLVEYSWTGPNGFTSNMADIDVNEEGTYTFVVTAENGCTSTESFEVVGSSDIPDVSAVGGMLDCETQGIMLTGNSTTEGVTFLWSGPSGFSSGLQNPLVNEAGAYILTVTGTNGCVNSTTVEVTPADGAPNVSISGNDIDCNNSVALLMASSTTPNVTYSWTGPNGFSSTEQNPSVMEGGIYEVAVASEGNCVSNQTIQILVDTLAPSGAIQITEYNCDDKTTSLNGLSSDLNSSYTWKGPDGFSETGENVEVSVVGTYSLEIMGTNGCVNEITLEYDAEFDYDVDFALTEATTAEGGTATIDITGGTEPFTFIWDNSQTGETADDLDPGTHSVSVTDGLGCVREYTFEIMMTIATKEFLSAELIGVAPNPVSEYTNITWPENIFDVQALRITNVKGQTISQLKIQNSGNYTLEMHDQSEGIYFVTLIGQDKIVTVKIIKI